MEMVQKKKIPVITPLIKFFKNFHKRFKEGSLGTKLSHFIMGAGNFYHKQYVKGAMYLLIQAAFVWFMIAEPEVNSTPLGFSALGNLFTLGEIHEEWPDGAFFPDIIVDYSALMLLFGVITIGLICVYLFAWTSSIKSSYKADLDILDEKKPTTFIEDCKSLLDDRFHVLMLTPTCLAALIFTILPTIFMILIAFTDFDKTHPMGTTVFDWVQFKNFVDVFQGQGEIADRFLPVLGWTVIWAIVATFTNYFGGILLALLINKKEVKFKKLWRTVFILTIALPQFISLLAVAKILSPEGPFNGMLIKLGILEEGMEFLGNAKNINTARIMVLVVNLWVGVPYTMLQTSGILMNIPTDLYEAATIDGANKNQMFWNITLPYIIFVTTPYLISSFVGNINSFNIIFLLTNGGPSLGDGSTAGGTDLLVTWLYKLTVESGNYNLGAVIGIFTFMITSTITLVTYRRSKAYNEEDTFQ